MAKKKILMVISQEIFRDEELFHPKDVFEKKGFEVFVAAGEMKEAHGAYGAKVMPDITISDAAKKEYDAVVVVGGNGTPEYLWGNQTLLNIVKTQHAAGRPVAAICLGPVVLARAGILKGVEATMFKEPETVSEFAKYGVITSQKDVVVSGKIVTGNGPVAARKFGLAVADLLK